MMVAMQQYASRVLIAPNGAAMFRGEHLHLVAPSAGEMYPMVFDYCRSMAGLPEGQNDIGCVISADGSPGPESAEGRRSRMQVMTDGRVWAIQVLFQP